MIFNLVNINSYGVSCRLTELSFNLFAASDLIDVATLERVHFRVQL